jgi:hypothetical protein
MTRVAIYTRVSTGGQTTQNQLRELRAVARREGIAEGIFGHRLKPLVEPARAPLRLCDDDDDGGGDEHEGSSDENDAQCGPHFGP